MMKRRIGIRELLALGFLLVSVALIVLSVSFNGERNDPDKAAQKVSKVVERRMAILDNYIVSALTADKRAWAGSQDLPEDMVIYRYISDSLQSWSNQFPVANDDITSKVIFQRLSKPLGGMESPLADITEDVSFRNYGSKWYLMKSSTLGTRTVIAGLEIVNSMDESSANGVNPKLGLSRNYSIIPLSSTGGSAVVLDGKPVFKVTNESMTRGALVAHSAMVWLALACFILAALLHLTAKRTMKRLAFVLCSVFMVMAGTYFWGLNIRSTSSLFSPSIYADGLVLNSLGAVLIISITLIISILCIFATRKDIYRKILESKNSRTWMLFFAFLMAMAILGVCAYINMIFRSIIQNSSIGLEIYKLSELDIYSLLVYLLIFALVMVLPFLFQMLFPALKNLFNLKHDAFSAKGRFLLAFLFALYVILTAGTLGFRKEQNRVDIWANQLSIDRDISLELQLRENEAKIATDQMIGALSIIPNANNIILNRIIESYLYRISQNNDIIVELFSAQNNDQQAIAYFNSVLASGTRISNASRFLYLRDASGHTIYTGNFVYYNEEVGVTNMLLTVSPKSNREDRGYARLLGYSAPGEVLIPSKYSYGKYSSDKLLTFKGNYSYPTVLDEETKANLLEADGETYHADSYTHFVNSISDQDMIIISRPKTDTLDYIVAFLFMALIMYFCLSFITLMYKINRKGSEKSYYKSRINAAIMLSLVMTLIILASVSIFFVYKRNNANLRSSMSDRVTSIQTLLQARCRFAQSYRDLNTQDAASVLEDISNTVKSDITLFTTGGKLFRSTTPEVIDRMLIGMRINQNAYENIVFKNKRFFINKEKIGNKGTYFLYAPLFNAQGTMIAIMGSPFTDDSFDFRSEAVVHVATILTVFLILLLLARFVTAKAVDRMFKPLSEIGEKMNNVSIDNPEYIVYEREDEVSRLVNAYNMMVHDLYNSTKQLTQAERDKAWATMARQVAHEIKNPLTPIKLQIQRLIRMKSNGNPAWASRFDEISEEILKQIDLLADTANEFSTFARLYTEEPVEIDLDRLLSDEIMLFDTHEDIDISYIGLEKATVVGPKPQLTRVFTNLISNAVQAIENEQNEQRENGEEPLKGMILVSLRLSQKDGYYDIVVEDNGPGVSDENRSKLFTPNFTTKSNGTGLGLSICRNIIEKCNGTISYSKSFSLKGACFTVRYPRK